MKVTVPSAPPAAGPTIPGLQNSWQPAVYPLPAQAPAAPQGLDPASVYSFGGNFHQSNDYAPTVNGSPGTVWAQAPYAPAAPGYIGPSSAMAYQMAGPRVGFRMPGQSMPQPEMPSPAAPPASSGAGFGGGWGGIIRGLASRLRSGSPAHTTNPFLSGFSA